MELVRQSISYGWSKRCPDVCRFAHESCNWISRRGLSPLCVDALFLRHKATLAVDDWSYRRTSTVLVCALVYDFAHRSRSTSSDCSAQLALAANACLCFTRRDRRLVYC